jgi:hypothetical protein
MSDGVEAWATFRGTIHPSRNAVVHRGDLADRATAEIEHGNPVRRVDCLDPPCSSVPGN